MHDYRNETDWITPVLAFVVWTAHFALLWAASSIFPDQPAARWIAAALTVIAFLALLFLWRRGAVTTVASIPGLGLAVAAAGVAFSMIPAIIG